MSHNDSNFYKPFVFVLGALLIFTAFIMFVANVWSPDSPDDPLAVAAMKKSIQPVGQSRVEEVVEPVEAEAPDESAGDSAAMDSSTGDSDTAEADTDTDTVAATETDTGDAAATTEAETATATEEAPAAADTAATATAAVAATAATGTVIFDKDTVPLKVKATVATNCAGCHNAGLNGAAKTDDSDAWTALSDKGLNALTASVINGKGKMPARAESSLSDEEIGQAVQLMVSNATGSTEMAAGAVAGASASTAAAAPTVATTDEADATAEDTSAAVASAEIPEAVKQTVDTTCTACHLTGVGNAPKLGDKDAWGKRLEAKGIDGLTASAIAGIAVMPPRGGSTLDDEQMKLAVEYILSK